MTSTSLRRLLPGLVLIAMTTATVSAQEPAFEVASVRPSSDGAMALNVSIPGAATLEGISLRYIIALAFNVDVRFTALNIDYAKISAERLERSFTIRAKGDPQVDTRAMLRTLLKERFGLRYHTESREVSVYALELKEPGKLGPWLKPTQVNCEEHLRTPREAREPLARPCSAQVQRYGASGHRFSGTLKEFVSRVAQHYLLDRLVIDATGLEGNYEWEIAFTPREIPVPGGPPTFREALEDQLGLTIKNRRGQHEIIILDDVRMPTPN